MTKQRNHTIDILRLIAAFFIICLHNFSSSGVWLSEEIVALSRFAVPLFFLFSGYFSVNFSRKRKLRQMVRILAWAVLANVGYLAIDLSRQKNEYLFKLRLQQIFYPGAWKNFLLYNDSPISGHLWFLGALAYILLLDLLFSSLFEKLHRGIRWCVVGVLLFGGLALYHVLTLAPDVDYPLCAYRNFLLFGLPFFLSGKLIRGSSFAAKPLPAPLYPVLILALSGLTLLEFHLAGVWELYLSSILMTYLLMHLALCHPLSNARGPAALLSWLGRNTTLAIYIVHIYVLDQLRGLYWSHLPWQYEFGVFHLIPIGVFLASLLIGVAVALFKTGCIRCWDRLAGRSQPRT